MNRWRTTIQHVKQYKQLSESSVYVGSMEGSSGEEGKTSDELSIIMNVYAERLTKSKNGRSQLMVHVHGTLIKLLLLPFDRRLHFVPLRARVKRDLSNFNGELVSRDSSYSGARR